MNAARPDPQALLAREKHGESAAARGKLKVFFGASAGVGKTYAMLLAARSAKAEGREVVVGIVETHGRAETARLAEGLEETLTIHRLGVPEKLRKTLFSTNPIESAFSVVEEKCGRVKKWQGGDMKLRWVASGLLFVEGQFRKVKGYREIPQLMAALKAAVSGGKPAAVATARRVG